MTRDALVRPRSLSFWLATVVVGGALVTSACPETPPAPTDCSPACAASEPACLDGCPAIARELCVEGACVARGDDSVDVVVTVSVDRNVDGVAALLLAVVDARVAGCDDVGDVPSATGVLFGNRFEVQPGASFFPDLSGGLVPPGDVVVAIEAVDDDGRVKARGCTPAQATGASVAVTVSARP